MKSKDAFYIPSIADIIFLSVLFRIVSQGNSALLGDGDTGYHIRAGEFILNHLSIPRHDIFSFLSPSPPWTVHEWLSEVVMAMVHHASGMTGVVVLYALLIASIYFCLFKFLQITSQNIILVTAVVFLATASSSLHWLARPHIFSLFLTVQWYRLLNKYQYQDRNQLILLPPIMLLWVNLHGGFVVGLLLIAVYLIGNVLESLRLLSWNHAPDWSKTKTLATIGACCLLASLVNPQGYHILYFPFELTANTFIMDHVKEFLSPNFHQPLPYKYLLLLLIGVLAVSRETTDFIELSLVLLFTYMSLYSARHIPIFAIITAPIILRLIDARLAQSQISAVHAFTKMARRIASNDLAMGGWFWPAAGSLSIIALAASGTIHFQFSTERFPVAAIDFLKKEHVRGNMFNNDEFGDYIIYRAWPQYKVFSDGRSDMYGADRGREYFKVVHVEPGWENVLRKYDINWIIYNTHSTLSEILLTKGDWQLVYADNTANIFVKNDGRNGSLLAKYSSVKPIRRDN